MIRVTFVHQSCFVVELDRTVLVFDYFPAGRFSDTLTFGGKLPAFPEGKQVIFFASNANPDHFSPEIFAFLKETNASYVLSSDIKLRRDVRERYGIGKEEKRRIRRIGPLSHCETAGVSVSTLRSTGTGVAFYVEAEGIHIYHAGDLHWWNSGARGELYSEMNGANYRRELRHIRSKHTDIAFVVLDPRLGDGSTFGMKYFLEHIPADVVFPMQMWRDYSIVQRLKEDPELVMFRDKVVDIDRENIIFNLQ